MRLRQTPPVLPGNLRDRVGEPEDVFGPNRRFRTASTIVGGALVLLGVGFCLVGAADLPAGGAPGRPVYLLVGGGLLICGLAAVVLPRQAPPTWVFVCRRGLVRVRGAEWEVVEWAEVLRVEDATLPTGVTTRQCRVVLAGGGEWGFLANYVADFPRLTEVLRRKVAERGPSRLGTADPGAASDRGR
jgi:hypothetical protein